MRTLVCLVLACVVSLGAKEITGAIVLTSEAPQLGQPITFDFSCSGCPNKPASHPRILVNCYQNAVLVYGEAFAASAGGIDPLGGAGSLWLYGIDGGDPYAPAHCVATLFYFGSVKGQQTYFPIATTEFDAAGL